MDTSDDLLHDLLTAEHAGWAALCDGSASAHYGRTMTDDGQWRLALYQQTPRA